MSVELKLLRSSHCVGESNFHLQFTPKYRKGVFSNPVIKGECERLLLCIAKKMGVMVAGIGFGPDHAHLFVSACKNYSAARLAMRLKGASSRFMRANLYQELKQYYWGNSFWSDGYFYRSVGAVNYDTMKDYVERSQDKHWIKQRPSEYRREKQATLSQWAQATA